MRVLLALAAVLGIGLGVFLYTQLGSTRSRQEAQADAAPDAEQGSSSTDHAPLGVPQSPGLSPLGARDERVREAVAGGGSFLRGSVWALNAPVRGATVAIFELGEQVDECSSNDRGEFLLRSHPAIESARLKIRAAGFAPFERAIEDAGRRSSVGVINLQPQLELKGTVVDVLGDAVSGAEVSVESSEGSNLHVSRARTDRQGRFVIADAARGPLTILVNAARRGGARLEIRHLEPQDIQIQLERVARLLLRLHDEKGQPATDAVVHISSTDPVGVVLQERTDEDGRCVFDALTSPTWNLRVVDARYRPKTISNLRTGESEVRVELSAWPCITGKVTTQERQAPPRGTLAHLLPVGPSGKLVEIDNAPEHAVEQDGSFRICGVRPGRYAVRVEAEGFAPGQSETVKVGIEGDVSVRPIFLTQGGILLLRLTDGGAPLVNAKVELHLSPPPPDRLWVDPAAAAYREGRTDESGELRFEHLAAGQVWLLLRSREHVPCVQGPFEILDGRTLEPHLARLRKGARIQGSIAHPRDGTAYGSLVTLRSSAGDVYIQVKANREGEFISPPLPSGTWSVQARFFAGGSGPRLSDPLQVVLSEGQQKEIDISL
jgi:hypothetical protein